MKSKAIRTVKVKTLWNGMVGVNGKYLRASVDKDQPLVIEHQELKMTIKPGDIKERIKARSDRQFRDRFGGVAYWLYYFDWKPDPEEQPSLFS